MKRGLFTGLPFGGGLAFFCLGLNREETMLKPSFWLLAALAGLLLAGCHHGGVC